MGRFLLQLLFVLFALVAVGGAVLAIFFSLWFWYTPHYRDGAQLIAGGSLLGALLILAQPEVSPCHEKECWT